MVEVKVYFTQDITLETLSYKEFIFLVYTVIGFCVVFPCRFCFV